MVQGTFEANGLTMRIAAIVSDTELTLALGWPGATITDGAAFLFGQLPASAALSLQTNEDVRTLLQRLSLKGELLDGAGAPLAADGDNGDAYIDTQNADLYLKKEGSWGSPAANLKGDTGDSLKLDAVGLASARSTHDNAAALFTFMAEDTGQISIKRSATSGDWSAWIDFQGPQGVQGDTGAAGTNGTNGADGADGADGAVWSAGTLPDNLTGADGDFHLESDGDVHQKIAGAWTPSGINLEGPQGIQGNPGLNGSDGSQGLQGPQGESFVPDAQEPAANRTNYDAAADGFAFLATDTNQTGGAWIDTGTVILGPQGIQGNPGLDGTNGLDGADGAVWSIGTVPGGGVGADGDMHLETGGQVYQKVAGTWTDTGQNLTGPQGAQGVPGEFSSADLATAAQIRNPTASKLLDPPKSYEALAPVSLTSGTSIAVDMNTGINFDLVLAHNGTIQNPTNPVVGKNGFIFVTTSGTNRTLNWGSYWLFDGSTPPDLAATSGALAVFSYFTKSATQLITGLSGKEFS
eukprot:g17212.t1